MGRIQGGVHGVAQSADLVLAASYGDCALRAWSKKDGALVLEMKTPNDKAAISVAVQGNLAAVGTGFGGLFLIDLATASTRRRKGLPEDVAVAKYFDDPNLLKAYERAIRRRTGDADAASDSGSSSGSGSDSDSDSDSSSSSSAGRV
ncbi:116 kDa U5 small nuclear ribonucleoprotein component [Hondaea fermentalgiana]|uniref:116 kDa U5 small nuclear ribonucleoprotein component n=1 Tax=Hondaea fermentalgiana TaxID=2315210 RepID=A0A2R5GZG7_9STRA|nr:116 kDa U5 small nuclear ribonucleoprotein component [Hondaea fermentalgiana]|eukprot:GBG33871.1 116 kDa U5 small nuclear ribonucleoprotein component [Hondaea fermentalgiana]